MSGGASLSCYHPRNQYLFSLLYHRQFATQNAFERVNILRAIIIDIFTFHMIFDIDTLGLIVVISEYILVIYLIPKSWYENARAYKV